MTEDEAQQRLREAAGFLYAAGWDEHQIHAILRREQYRTVVEREPWPEKGIEEYTNISDGGWGYLHHYSDGSFEFNTDDQPSKSEILSRWGRYFESETDDERYQ